MPVRRRAPVKTVVSSAVRHGSPAALAARRPPAQAGHLGRQTGLVDEDELRRIEIELALEPGAGAPQDVGAVLLSACADFFERPARADQARRSWRCG